MVEGLTWFNGYHIVLMIGLSTFEDFTDPENFPGLIREKKVKNFPRSEKRGGRFEE